MPFTRPLFAAALSMFPLAAAADVPINVVTWGGDFTAAQKVAFADPFTAETGVRVNLIDADSVGAVIKAQVAAGNVTTDVASLGQADAERLCDEGLAEPIDPALIVAGADGTAAADDFLPGGLSDCFVATDVYSTVIGYDARAMGAARPTSITDFFDLQKFPGRRGVLKEPRFTLEMALMGDGLGHVALTGVAVGVLTSTAPVGTALVAAVLGAVLTIVGVVTELGGSSDGDEASDGDGPQLTLGGSGVELVW